MDIVTKRVVSASKSIKAIKARMAELDARISQLPAANPARRALEQLQATDRKRLERLEEEVKALEAIVAAPGDRQVELPGARRPGKS